MRELGESTNNGLLVDRSVHSESQPSKMSDLLHTHPIDTAVHDASGAVKLYTEPSDHLARLLAPETEIP